MQPVPDHEHLIPAVDLSVDADKVRSGLRRLAAGEEPTDDELRELFRWKHDEDARRDAEANGDGCPAEAVLMPGGVVVFGTSPSLYGHSLMVTTLERYVKNNRHGLTRLARERWPGEFGTAA